MADEVNSVTVGEVKSAKSRFLDLLPKISPFIALAGAGLALLFTFLIGVSSNAEGLPDYFIYRFFDGDYINSVSLLTGAAKEAARAVMLSGMLLTIFGLLAVIASAGITVYKAVLKYAYKKECNIEFFALLTYLSYAVFSALFYALNCVIIKSGDTVTRTGYNAATVCGLTLTSAVFCTYYVFKALINRGYLKDRVNLVKFIYSLARIAVLAVILGLASAPLVEVGANGAVTKSSFIQLLINGTAGYSGDKLSSLASTSSAGFLLLAIISVLFAVLTADNVSVLFSNKKNDLVFYVIAFALTLLIMIIAAVAGGFFSDILGNLATKDVVVQGTEQIKYIRTAGGFNITVAIVDKIIDDSTYDIVRELCVIRISAVIPVIISVLALAVVVLTACYPLLVSVAGKKAEQAAAEECASEKAFLEIDALSQHFVIGKDFFGRPTKTLKAVDNVTFKLEKGKTLGIVGESGCGKTTMGRTILRLYDVTSGEVWFKGKKISSLGNREFDKLRPNMQMIFQDPYASLSPRLTVGDIIGEAVKQHKLVSKEEYHDYIISVMKMCGLQPHYFERYPHEFSGGQRQRICIARALALKPELVICDEPVSALDVSIQAQIINMLIELRKSLGLTYIFISHDLSVVKHISDEVGVMYLGSLVEYGSKESIFENTLHPYTRALFSAVPVPDPNVKMNRIILKGDIPSPVNPPKGCKFHTRCDSCMEICGRIAPIYKEVEKGHFCACHLYNTEEDVQMLERTYEEEQRNAEEEAKLVKKGFIDKVKDIFRKKPENDTVKPEAEDVPKE